MRRSVIARLSPFENTVKMRQELRALTGDSGAQIGSRTVRFSKVMRAVLVGPDFDIDPLGTDRDQAVSETEPTIWEWSVRPRTTGNLALELRLSVLIEVDGQTGARPFRVLSERVIVTSTLGDQAEDVWKWIMDRAEALAIIATALAAVAAWFWRRRPKRWRPRKSFFPQSPPAFGNASDELPGPERGYPDRSLSPELKEGQSHSD
jgi:hypothetical protein